MSGDRLTLDEAYEIVNDEDRASSDPLASLAWVLVAVDLDATYGPVTA